MPQDNVQSIVGAKHSARRKKIIKGINGHSIISKTITINSPKLPPDVNYIEEQIKLQGLEPVRWAIVDTNKNMLTISVSGYIM